MRATYTFRKVTSAEAFSRANPLENEAKSNQLLERHSKKYEAVSKLKFNTSHPLRQCVLTHDGAAIRTGYAPASGVQDLSFKSFSALNLHVSIE